MVVSEHVDRFKRLPIGPHTYLADVWKVLEASERQLTSRQVEQATGCEITKNNKISFGNPP